MKRKKIIRTIQATSLQQKKKSPSDLPDKNNESFSNVRTKKNYPVPLWLDRCRDLILNRISRPRLLNPIFEYPSQSSRTTLEGTRKNRMYSEQTISPLKILKMQHPPY
ncbi:hypothetical protein TNIN_313071 [Trichonephila inaurata madagascariensis]|uniref:Uncharacterized protein n=1 Tax=Trichonephila inaurata madagascariensis TaxID=2747483 RepID=A0A8X6YJ75_9ARAC|nr:hypothetical protein TNIN_313071 [Trichonephila inaurata madagascariensis]